MQTEQLTNFLDDSEQSKEWLCRFGFHNIARGQANLQAIARSGMTLDLFASLISRLEAELPETSDPDMALNNLERFIEASRSPLALGALFSRDATAIPLLLRIFSASQYLSDLLITDPEAYDTLRLTANQLLDLKQGLRSGENLEPDSRESQWHAPTVLEREICDEIRNARDARHAMAILRRFKRRETLRIAYGDLIGGHRIVDVTREISYVADAVCQAALQWSGQQLVEKWGVPLDRTGEKCGFVVLALGKLGGQELNYSSDIDLIMVYRVDGQTGKGKPNRQYFERLTRDFTKLMNESTGLGAAYRVDLRLRPEGEKGPVCNSLQAMLQYYDLKGRTWERQAFIKARAIAGDLELGRELLDRLQPWIYGSYLRRSEIESVRALKRQIERRAIVDGQDRTNVKTGHGGIRDIEFAIQFLQLLHGGSMPEVRTGNTLQAIVRLEPKELIDAWVQSIIAPLTRLAENSLAEFKRRREVHANELYVREMQKAAESASGSADKFRAASGKIEKRQELYKLVDMLGCAEAGLEVFADRADAHLAEHDDDELREVVDMGKTQHEDFAVKREQYLKRKETELLGRSAPKSETHRSRTELLRMPFEKHIPQEYWPNVLDWSHSNMTRLFKIGYETGQAFVQTHRSRIESSLGRKLNETEFTAAEAAE